MPPDDPQYTLRRVWLSKEEEQGYYFGFANEGLWPLCHIAHTRPIFRTDGLGLLSGVNPKFADALVDEMEGQSEPLVWCRTITSPCFRAMIKESGRTRASPSSGTFHGPIRRLSDLPLAARIARWHAGRGPDRLSHSGALQ